MSADWCSLCVGGEHLNQEYRGVMKHSHGDDYSCTRPWSALCQSEHGDICYASDHTSQQDALTAMCDHLRRADHVDPGSGDRDAQTPCRKVAA